MKFTVFVCIVLVTVAQNGAQAGFIGRGLAKADHLADVAIEKAEAALGFLKEKTDMLSQGVQGIVDMFILGVRKQVTDAVDMVDNKVLEIIGADPKVSECAVLAENLHDTADAKVANVSQCAVDKLEQADGYIQFIYNITGEQLSDIKNLKEELKNCTTNVHGFAQTIGAVLCADKVALKAGVVTAKKIPSIGVYIVELEAFVNTLPASLSYCAARNGILTFVQNAGGIVIGVKDCVAEIITGTTTTAESDSITTTTTEASESIATTTTEASESTTTTTTEASGSTTTTTTEASESIATTTTKA